MPVTANILLSQTIFVAVFTTFLTQCVDWPKVPHSRKLSDVVISQCTKKISGMPNVAIWLFTLHVFWRIFQLVADIPRLIRIRDFYLHLLDVPESDMQTVSWQDVVARIMALRDANPVTTERISPATRKYLGSQSKQRLDAHDIANRLMRRENYLIALFNKEVLDLTLPIPFLQGRQFFSRALLWNIDWCIMDLIFNDLGQVRQLVLKDSHRRQLSDGLRNRFLFSASMNAILAPVIVIYLMLVYFLRYFNVRSPQYFPRIELTSYRNSKTTLLPLDHGNTLPLPNGNSASSMSLIICSTNGSTCRTPLHHDIWISFPKSRLHNLQDLQRLSQEQLCRCLLWLLSGILSFSSTLRSHPKGPFFSTWEYLVPSGPS